MTGDLSSGASVSPTITNFLHITDSNDEPLDKVYCCSVFTKLINDKIYNYKIIDSVLCSFTYTFMVLTHFQYDITHTGPDPLLTYQNYDNRF